MVIGAVGDVGKEGKLFINIMKWMCGVGGKMGMWRGGVGGKKGQERYPVTWVRIGVGLSPCFGKLLRYI